MAGEVWFCRKVARALVAGKIRNQRTFLLRNHVEPEASALREMKNMAERAEESDSMEELLGLECVRPRGLEDAQNSVESKQPSKS
jgi:CRISP-associated protein Cas1